VDDSRPDFIKHYSEIQQPDDKHYPGSDELLAIRSSFGKTFGFERLGINHDVLPPGRRTSWPHAESTEEEFVYVIEGTPDVWIDGQLHHLRPGDGVGFPPGTGIAHTFLNNSSSDVRLLVIGEADRKENKIFYPKHPERNNSIGDLCWRDIPKRELGPHNGTPNKR
jgi:uncharacterized cupin superfamily protein